MQVRPWFAVFILGACVASAGAYASYRTATQNGSVSSLNLSEVSSQALLAQAGNSVADPRLDMSGQIKDAKVAEAQAHDAASLSYISDGVSLKASQDESDVDHSHPVPLPSTIWLFGSALIGFVTMSNRRRV